MNWVEDSTPRHLRTKAEKILKKVKSQRKKKEYRLVKICDRPLTYKEIEIKD